MFASLCIANFIRQAEGIPPTSNRPPMLVDPSFSLFEPLFSQKPSYQPVVPSLFAELTAESLDWLMDLRKATTSVCPAVAAKTIAECP